MKKYIMLCGILVLIIPHLIKAQEVDSLFLAAEENISLLNSDENGDDNPFPNYSTPLSVHFADVNMMTRGIDTSTDKYTGFINIKIPLCELTINNKKVPVALSYQTTGIRLEDKASEVGLGWQLNAGGKITRVLKGAIDKFEQLKEVDENAEKWNLPEFNNHLLRGWDTQPDIYYFELPELCGSFVFDVNGKPQTIPYQNIKIQYEHECFTIFDHSGTMYVFKTKEKVHETETRNGRISCDITYIATWFLDRIEFLNGATVHYKYESDLTGYSTISHNSLTKFDCTTIANRTTAKLKTNNAVKFIEFRREVLSPKYLSSIEYKEQKILFEYDDAREDIPNYRRLNKIGIHTEDVPDRFIDLTYDVFPDLSPKLLSVSERPEPDVVRDICCFEYYEDVYLPVQRNTYFGFDHWGFCNSNELKPERYPNSQLILPNITTSFGGSRSPDLSFTRSQSLKKIIYPNGGSKELIYELHQGKNLLTNRIENAGGLRIKKIIERDNNDVSSVYSYKYLGGIIYDDAFNYISEYAGNIEQDKLSFKLQISAKPVSSSCDFFGASVVYSSVIEYLPNKSYIIYDYIPMDEYPDLNPEQKTLGIDVPPKFEIRGRSPKTVRSWGRNLLQAKEWFASDGSSIRKETYQYLIDTCAAIEINSRLVYFDKAFSNKIENYGSVFRYNKYRFISCPVLPTKQIIEKRYQVLPKQVTYSYNEQKLPYLTVEKGCDGNWSSVYQKYPTDFSLLSQDTLWRNIINRNLNKPIETITYKNGKVIHAEINLYRFNENNSQSIVPSEDKGLRYQQAIDSATFKPSLAVKGFYDFDEDHYKTARYYDEYDKAGNLLCYHDNNGIYHSTVYNEGSAFPCAFVDNARHSANWNVRSNQVYFNDFEKDGIECANPKSGRRVCKAASNSYVALFRFKPGKYILSYWYKTSDTTPWKIHREELDVTVEMNTYIFSAPASAKYIDDISLIPKNATIRSQVERAFIGKISETDEAGRSTYYEYNNLGLPSKVYDNERVLINKYSYDNYAK